MLEAGLVERLESDIFAGFTAKLSRRVGSQTSEADWATCELRCYGCDSVVCEYEIAGFDAGGGENAEHIAILLRSCSKLASLPCALRV